MNYDMETGPVPGKPGYCYPAWEKKTFEGIKGPRWVCDECGMGPCLMHPSDARILDSDRGE